MVSGMADRTISSVAATESQKRGEGEHTALHRQDAVLKAGMSERVAYWEAAYQMSI